MRHDVTPEWSAKCRSLLHDFLILRENDLDPRGLSLFCCNQHLPFPVDLMNALVNIAETDSHMTLLFGRRGGKIR